MMTNGATPMTIDYTPLYEQQIKYKQLADGLTADDIRREVHRLYDATKAILLQCDDADITFEPYDEHAHDPYAADHEQHIGWTLGHLVAHITASNEEGFVFSALLAQGIPQGGRIRNEVDWQTLDTVEKAVQRLEESRRIVLAYLDAWPDTPNLTTYRAFSERAAAYFGDINAVASTLTGLSHHNEHMAQFAEVLQQAHAAKAKTA